ncbi:COX15/CtaA family protein [Nocardioides bigeumensis]|uniref:COX15/CtaA family protein n=1 Tax=Nocardioides bigeumensis TaxID=433657 RepID=A0ABN2Y0W8_9ACTN
MALTPPGAVEGWLWRLSVANLVANMLIVVTGGAVRVTGSGLGCPTWPRCTEGSYRPHGALGVHGAIEFGNRMLTFVLVAIAIACWVAALVLLVRRWRATRPWRFFWLATGVVLGIPAQAVIGGFTVLTDLNPYVVAFHLLVSMALIGLCVVLVDAQRGPPRPAAPPRMRRLTWVVFAAAWVVLYLGTVVTGSGPHSGDLDARRTGLDPQLMSHVHAIAVYVLVAVTVGLVVTAHRTGAGIVLRAGLLLLGVELAQGFVGFTQYFLDLPEALVVLHLLGAALVSACATAVPLSARARDAGSATTETGKALGQPSSGSTATATKSSAR